MEPAPLFEVTRGNLVESVHYGSIAVVDSKGQIVASHGDPEQVAFLRSSAKPFQVLPFVEHGGLEKLGFSPRELALACASHEGSDLHVQTVEAMQAKADILEADLQCGTHLPADVTAFKTLICEGREPTANRNNCSGKHTAMLAYAKLRDLPLENYLDPLHPIQQDILAAFAGMCQVRVDEVQVGIDGCSAPNFAVPLYKAALGVARLCDPSNLSEERAWACHAITAAMSANPGMVSGFGEFDCELMKAGDGGIVCKRGAEGYQVVGILPGVLGPDSPGLGIALKVSDGDPARTSNDLFHRGRVRPAVILEILRQLGALTSEQAEVLASFGPVGTIRNHRGLDTGQSRPVFSLQTSP